jgi:hypothetical protein
VAEIDQLSRDHCRSVGGEGELSFYVFRLSIIDFNMRIEEPVADVSIRSLKSKIENRKSKINRGAV